MNKFALAVAALASMSSASLGEGMIQSSRLPCHAVADIVSRRGAVLLATGGDNFDRYVSDQGKCARDEVITPAWIKTADNATCFVGYTCDIYNE